MFKKEIKYYAKYGVNFDFESMMFRKASLEHFLSERQNVVLDNSFENLFRKLYKDEDEIKRKTKSMYKYYSPEKEKEYGVLGIEIKLIKII